MRSAAKKPNRYTDFSAVAIIGPRNAAMMYAGIETSNSMTVPTNSSRVSFPHEGSMVAILKIDAEDDAPENPCEAHRRKGDFQTIDRQFEQKMVFVG